MTIECPAYRIPGDHLAHRDAADIGARGMTQCDTMRVHEARPTIDIRAVRPVHWCIACWSTPDAVYIVRKRAADNALHYDTRHVAWDLPPRVRTVTDTMHRIAIAAMRADGRLVEDPCLLTDCPEFGRPHGLLILGPVAP